MRGSGALLAGQTGVHTESVNDPHQVSSLRGSVKLSNLGGVDPTGSLFGLEAGQAWDAVFISLLSWVVRAWFTLLEVTCDDGFNRRFLSCSMDDMHEGRRHRMGAQGELEPPKLSS